MKHWAMEYIGKPWVYGAKGPDFYDCWGFVCHVQSSKYGIETLLVESPKTWTEARDQIKNHPERQRWLQVETPVDGDVVLMARNKIPVHVGVVIIANDRIGILHCAQGCGVVFQSKKELAVSGWGSMTYFRHIK